MPENEVPATEAEIEEMSERYNVSLKKCGTLLGECGYARTTEAGLALMVLATMTAYAVDIRVEAFERMALEVYDGCEEEPAETQPVPGDIHTEQLRNLAVQIGQDLAAKGYGWGTATGAAALLTQGIYALVVTIGIKRATLQMLVHASYADAKTSSDMYMEHLTKKVGQA